MRRSLAALALALVLLGCGRDAPTPEEAVRATLAELEDAARSRDASRIEEHISESYADKRRNDKRALVRLATAHMIRNQSVYTLSRVLSLELPEPQRADVVLIAALASRPIPDADALAQVRADVYRFELALSEEKSGAWRVTSADWQPATLADLR
jgi:outer membrane PBP1 activator LpoA protein